MTMNKTQALSASEPIYTLAGQQQAIMRFCSLMDFYGIDLQDALVFLQLPVAAAPADLITYYDKPMPAFAQYRLSHFEQIERTYRLMPWPDCFGALWFRTPDPALDGLAPIDLVLAADWKGLSVLFSYLSRQAIDQIQHDVLALVH